MAVNLVGGFQFRGRSLSKEYGFPLVAILYSYSSRELTDRPNGRCRRFGCETTVAPQQDRRQISSANRLIHPPELRFLFKILTLVWNETICLRGQICILIPLSQHLPTHNLTVSIISMTPCPCYVDCL